MTIHQAPWHTLTVSEAWRCDQAEPDTADLPCRDEDGWCTGHRKQAPGLRREIEHDLEHPADCESRPDYLDCLTADIGCDGQPDPLPTAPGLYRVRAWMRMPGELFDGPGAGLECVAGLAGGAS